MWSRWLPALKWQPGGADGQSVSPGDDHNDDLDDNCGDGNHLMERHLVTVLNMMVQMSTTWWPARRGTWGWCRAPGRACRGEWSGCWAKVAFVIVNWWWWITTEWIVKGDGELPLIFVQRFVFLEAKLKISKNTSSCSSCRSVSISSSSSWSWSPSRWPPCRSASWGVPCIEMCPGFQQKLGHLGGEVSLGKNHSYILSFHQNHHHGHHHRLGGDDEKHFHY